MQVFSQTAGNADEDYIRREIERLSPPSVHVTRDGEHPVDYGGFSDVYRGRRTCDGVQVAIKALRFRVLHSSSYQRVVREVSIWSSLDHVNVLPFYGVSMQWGARNLCLVSPWMPHGNVRKFLKACPTASRTLLVSGVALGLAYLHGKHIIHGDLKGANVFVGPDGEPRLADFGLSRILDEEVPGQTSSIASSGSVRWMAPERIDPGKFGLDARAAYSTMSDIYSFGMTIYEIFLENVPFATIGNPAVCFQVINGVRPHHPGLLAIEKGLDGDLWSFVQQCWLQDTTSRPLLSQLLRKQLPSADLESDLEHDGQRESRLALAFMNISLRQPELFPPRTYAVLFVDGMEIETTADFGQLSRTSTVS